MSRRSAFIAFLLVVIGVCTSTTRTDARVIHWGSISLEVPDTWKAHDGRESGGDSGLCTLDGQDDGRGSWEAFEAGESRGYLTAGVLHRSSPISPVSAPGTRRELETRLRELPRVEAVRVREFVSLEIDGMPAYRARYTLTTGDYESIEQSLYIVGGSETCFLAFTRAASSSPGEDESSFDEIMQRARVYKRPRLLGLSREWSLTILVVLAGSSLLFHLARGIAARSRVPVRVESRDRKD